MTRQITAQIRELESMGFVSSLEDGERLILTEKGAEVFKLLLAIKLADAADCSVHTVLNNAQLLTRAFMAQGATS